MLKTNKDIPQSLARVRLSLKGFLQGVGFRPFVYQLAEGFGLTGWVKNTPGGVAIEAEGEQFLLEQFLECLQEKSPPNSTLQNLESTYLEPVGYENFLIKDSENSGDKSTPVLPDIATCPDCLNEIFDPSNRRYLYPFTNCTHCGPRFSIIEELPYDRHNTSMKGFQMCKDCLSEFEDPKDRRFHAQPNACSVCGPHLELWDSSGDCLSKNLSALENAVSALENGSILACKGLGGFQLMVNACDDQAVRELRKRKHREEKPLALMFPSLSSVKKLCELSSREESILLSAKSPIVLLQRKLNADSTAGNISAEVAPSNPYFGVMLPSTPLHHILMSELGFPVVATSGNISGETICTDQKEALIRLGGIADLFLINNRPIVRHVDDSIVRVVLGDEQILRSARGYSPSSISLKDPVSPVLATGGQLKNTVAMGKGQVIYSSQHIGDLDNVQTVSAFEDTLQSLPGLYDFNPGSTVYDFHPDYSSTQWAEKRTGDRTPIQHHVAHVFSCMAEHGLEGPLLGVAWDGSGYGLDGTLWGGEFFHITSDMIHRVASFSPFPLPGGSTAIKEPRRSALGLCYKVFGTTVFDQPELFTSFTSEEITILKNMLNKGFNSPMTSSCGRLFDAVASMIGVRHKNSFEGQAAMDLEFLTQGAHLKSFYPVNLIECERDTLNIAENKNIPDVYDLNLKYKLDVTPLVGNLQKDISEKCSLNLVATKFHNGLAESIVTLAKHIGEDKVVLSGGCFQNKYLTEQVVFRLKSAGFKPFWHQKIPPNDGGLSLGQIYAASWIEKRKEVSSVFGGAR